MGGSQILVQQLSEQLHAAHGDAVTVFTTTAYHMESFWTPGLPMMAPGVERVRGVRVRRFPVFNRFNLLRRALAAVAYRLRLPYNDWLRTLQTGPLTWGLAGAVARSDADVVLAATFPLLHMYAALRGARRAGIPIVLLGALHTTDPWGYDRRMIYRAIRRADAYIALTAFERDRLLERGIEAHKITVVGPGVDASAFAQAGGAPVRHRYGWGDAPVVATVGKQTARKRFDVLLAAMERVWPAYPGARLLIAGATTSYSPRLAERVAALPAEQRARVTLVDDFPEAEKASLLAACDVFALPSGEESFGIAFLEAWACGKPVIGARVGAIPSVIDEGRDGLLVRYQDAGDLARAIRELLAGPERRARMGEAGRLKVMTDHRWPVVAGRVRAVYRRAIATRKGPPGQSQGD
jgi:glycosyltransferase involved in cell wall biosynthesis